MSNVSGYSGYSGRPKKSGSSGNTGWVNGISGYSGYSGHGSSGYSGYRGRSSFPVSYPGWPVGLRIQYQCHAQCYCVGNPFLWVLANIFRRKCLFCKGRGWIRDKGGVYERDKA